MEMIELSGMVIEIKASDIRESKRIEQEFKERKTTTYCRAESCPLAIALKRTFPEYRFAVVLPYMNVSRGTFSPHDCSVDKCSPHHRELVQLSEEARQFAYEADKRKGRIKAQTVRL